MFSSMIRSIISTKFQINPLTVTSFSGSEPKRPPPPPVAGEISKCRRLIIGLNLIDAFSFLESEKHINDFQWSTTVFSQLRIDKFDDTLQNFASTTKVTDEKSSITF